MSCRPLILAAFFASLSLSAVAQEGKPFPQVPYDRVSEVGLNRWIKRLANPTTQRVDVGKHHFVVVGHNVGSGLPVMSVYVFERSPWGYALKLSAQGGHFDRLRVTPLTAPARLRIEGVLSWTKSPNGATSGMKDHALIADLGL